MWLSDPQLLYLGCYYDHLQVPRKLAVKLGEFRSTNTPANCMAACHQAGYTYSGVQVTTQLGQLLHSSFSIQGGRFLYNNKYTYILVFR